MILRKILPVFVGGWLLFMPFSAIHAIDPAKQNAIIELIGVSGALNALKAMIPQITTMMSDIIKRSNPGVPKRALEILAEETNRTFMENENIGRWILDTAVIYDRYFTLDEIKEITAFYGTKAGQKAITTLPQIFQESMIAGQKWSESIMPKVIQRSQERWKAEGLDVKI